MQDNHWVKNFPAGIMAADAQGIITDMNDRCAETYQKDGGYDLLGKSAIECHKGAALEKARRLWDEQALNVYTITKNGRKKLIYQAPYFIDGDFAGMVELSLPLPEGEIPHFNRDKS
jgi:transcriptional regulator with PAS, ATPase and Fis domain